MTKSDEKEVHRLCDALRALHDLAGADALKHEALKKAGLALSIGFIHGLRPKIEEFYAKLDEPMSKEEEAELCRLGVPPK